MLDVQEILSHYHYAGILGLLILGGIGLPFPEDATLILTGFFISAGEIHPANAIATAFAGLVISDLTIYWGARRYGRKALMYRPFSLVASPGRVAWVEAKFHKYGSLVVLFGRIVPGLRGQVLLASGITRMPFFRFFLLDIAAMLVTMGIMIGLGYKGGENLPLIKEIIRDSASGIFAAAFAILAVYAAYRWVKARRERARLEQKFKDKDSAKAA